MIYHICSKIHTMNKDDIITTGDLIPIIEKIDKILGLLDSKNKQPLRILRSFQVREILGISPGTLQNLRIQGHLPYTKINGSCYYKREDVEKMLEENRSE